MSRSFALLAAVAISCRLDGCFFSSPPSTTSIRLNPSLPLHCQPSHCTMASRSFPKLVQSSARRVPSLAVPQQRALSSLRQAAGKVSAAQASSSSVRKTAIQAAGSVAARRYASTGEKSEYTVSGQAYTHLWWYMDGHHGIPLSWLEHGMLVPTSSLRPNSYSCTN
jgi:hypothetical protein